MRKDHRCLRVSQGLSGRLSVVVFLYRCWGCRSECLKASQGVLNLDAENESRISNCCTGISNKKMVPKKNLFLNV